MTLLILKSDTIYLQGAHPVHPWSSPLIKYGKYAKLQHPLCKIRKIRKIHEIRKIHKTPTPITQNLNTLYAKWVLAASTCSIKHRVFCIFHVFCVFHIFCVFHVFHVFCIFIKKVRSGAVINK